jgi:primary-amine oxidase
LKRQGFAGDVIFRVITLWEPRKSEMVPFLDTEHGGQRESKRPARLAKVQAHIGKRFSEFKLDLDREAVISEEELHGRHPHIDGDHASKAELACMADPRVKEQIAALKLPKGATVVVEPWTYGTDGMNDMSDRMTMVFLNDLVLVLDSLFNLVLVLVLHALVRRPGRKLLRIPPGSLRRNDQRPHGDQHL